MDSPQTDAAVRAFLRHTVATLAYRAGKTLRDAPPAMAQARTGEGAWTGTELVAHMADVLEWAASIARGEEAWRPRAAEDWDAQVARFFDALAALDATLTGDAPLGSEPERIFQGPIADALTHVGQLATLRRLVGAPVRGENYHRARIEAGRVGREQRAPVREFDRD